MLIRFLNLQVDFQKTLESHFFFLISRRKSRQLFAFSVLKTRRKDGIAPALLYWFFFGQRERSAVNEDVCSALFPVGNGVPEEGDDLRTRAGPVRAESRIAGADCDPVLNRPENSVSVPGGFGNVGKARIRLRRGGASHRSPD